MYFCCKFILLYLALIFTFCICKLLVNYAKHYFDYKRTFTLPFQSEICIFKKKDFDFFSDPCVYVNLEFKGGDLSVIPSLGYSACKEQCQKLKSCSFFSGRAHHMSSRIWNYESTFFSRNLTCFVFLRGVWDQNGKNKCVCVYPFIFYRFFRLLGHTTC